MTATVGNPTNSAQPTPDGERGDSTGSEQFQGKVALSLLKDVPARDAALERMKEALASLEPDPTRPSAFAQCWMTSSPADGEPFLHDTLYNFALSRGFEYTSAAKRFHKFNTALRDIGVECLRTMSAEIADCLSQGVWYIAPTPDSAGRPICYVTCRLVDWSRTSVQQMQWASLWVLWQLASIHYPVCQTKGVNLVLNMKGFSMSQFVTEFEKWIAYISWETLPIKFCAMFPAYQPFWLGSILYPLLKGNMQQKMQERVHWLGTSRSKVKAAFLETVFGTAEHLDSEVLCHIPEDLGGTLQLNGDTFVGYLRLKIREKRDTS